MTLDEPDKLAHLKLKMAGVPETLFLDGGRQSYSDHILTIDREVLPDPSVLSIGTEAAFLKPDPFIESDHPEMIEAAKKAVGTAVRPLEKARNLVAWVYSAIDKKPVLSVPTALETLRQRMGDCNEHAVLLAGLARAAGIPARVEAGLVYMDGRFYYHAWDSLYVGRWISADALMNQLPADVTHIRLIRGTSSEQTEILGTVGKITIQILEAH
jgi:transglutaminase-like putative cysteine protease